MDKLNCNVSQEYIASTIYHETFHAIVHYFDKDKCFFQNTPTDDHIAIFYTYLDLIASGLQKTYPNLTLREAQGLILKGMMDYKKEWGVLFDKILLKKNLQKINFVISSDGIAAKYPEQLVINHMKNYHFLILSILMSWSCNSSKEDGENPNFDSNATIADIDRSIQYTVSRYQFSVTFFKRNDSNHGGYKMFARHGSHWEKIEIREGVFDELQIKKDPDYYISRDITTRKLCKPEEAESFLSKLKALNVFEQPEESVLFKDCKDSGVTDLGSTYIEIVAGDRVRTLKYSGVYECSNGEWENLYKIEKLFENEWFENTLCK